MNEVINLNSCTPLDLIARDGVTTTRTHTPSAQRERVSFPRINEKVKYPVGVDCWRLGVLLSSELHPLSHAINCIIRSRGKYYVTTIPATPLLNQGPTVGRRG